jgi:hypothetical protein
VPWGIFEGVATEWFQADCTSMSHVEQRNGTLRQRPRLFTRLTKVFRKWENLKAVLSGSFARFNFCRLDASLNNLTPATMVGDGPRLDD